MFNQGDEGTSWYVILKGSVNVVIHGKGIVTSLQEGDDFGQLALINNAPRYTRDYITRARDRDRSTSAEQTISDGYPAGESSTRPLIDRLSACFNTAGAIDGPTGAIRAQYGRHHIAGRVLYYGWPPSGSFFCAKQEHKSGEMGEVNVGGSDVDL